MLARKSHDYYCIVHRLLLKMVDLWIILLLSLLVVVTMGWVKGSLPF